jgi:hypothetical protein
VRNLIWLASYPKSGNTWLRAFLSNLTFQEDKAIDINNMTPKFRANDKVLIEKYADIEPSELTDEELLSLRPKVYAQHSINSPNFPFIKIHDAYFMTNEQEPIVPSNFTFAVVYLIRNPLDIAASLAHHQQKPIDEIIDFMADDHAVINKEKSYYHSQTPEILLSWSKHVESWVNSGLNILVVRYEDMHEKTFETFSKISKFLKLDFLDSDIQRAIEFSDFQNLKEQEAKNGFIDKNMNAPNFFRKGKVGSGEEELSSEQIARIRGTHRVVMEQFKYI